MFLYLDRLCVAVLSGVALNPVDIASGKGKSDSATIGGTDVAEFLQLTDLFALIRRDSILISVIVILALLITMLFIKKSDKLADRKADILHKLGIVFVIASLVTILNILYAVVRGMFS